MTRPCASCGQRSCDGVACYLECPADHAEEGEGMTLDELNARHPEMLAEIRARLMGLPTADKMGDPFLRRKAA